MLFNRNDHHTVYHYKTSSGRNIIIDFTSRLDEDTQAKISEALKSLETKGLHLLFTNLCKKINHSPSIFELRIKSIVQVRILFCQVKNSNFLTLNIFIKKTQKTPKNEIKTALKRAKEYEKYLD